MKTEFFDYYLPSKLIAQEPASPRDSAKLMVIDRKLQKIENLLFRNIEGILGKSDVLVFNETKVIPARLYGKKDTGGKVEVLLVSNLGKGSWLAMTTPGVKDNQTIFFNNFSAKVVGHKDNLVILIFNISPLKLNKKILKYGKTPLPPYIFSKKSEQLLRKRYQTVYAKLPGSIAAPTAGFHFTNRLIKKLKSKGVQIEFVDLSVGLGTFLPVKTEDLEKHKMHSESFSLDKKTAEKLNLAKIKGKRIISVGTTTTRVLETCAVYDPKSKNYKVEAKKTETDIFIFPPYKFKFVDGLITNFHLPKSTLLALVSALVSYPNTNSKFSSFRESLIGKSYKKAIKKGYRFYSFGDASLII